MAKSKRLHKDLDHRKVVEATILLLLLVGFAILYGYTSYVVDR